MTDALPLLHALIAGHTSADEERQILDVLAGASPDMLNALLAGVDAAALFRSVDDRWLGPDHRTELTRLLTQDRIDDLTLESRAAILYALQAGWTSGPDEQGILAVLRATRGVDLTRLKNLVNSRTDSHDLEGLVFVDVISPDIRQQILDHIAAEASGFHTGECKVLSDIDDTTVCALHDDRYPRGIVYPGMLALLEALDRGVNAEQFSSGDLTFLTARPGDAFGLIEGTTRAALRKAGVGTSSVLTGSFLALRSHDAMAGRKLANVDHYRLLYPEYHLMFIGDSGQGDVLVGDKMWEAHPDAVRTVIIHDVVDTPASERARWASERIIFVDTHVGAACVAFEAGLITADGLRHVVAEARRGMDAVAWKSPAQESATRALFDADVSRAAALAAG